MAEGGGGEVVAAELYPAGFLVPPSPEFIAGGAGDGLPAEVNDAGQCAGGQDGGGQVTGKGDGDPLGPEARFAGGVEGANLVVVVGTGVEVGVREGGGGEVVAAELYPV